MDNLKQKPKSAYNIIPVFIRGDRKFVDGLKSKAALAGIPLADYVRESLDYAIANIDTSFFVSCGSDKNQKG